MQAAGKAGKLWGSRRKILGDLTEIPRAGATKFPFYGSAHSTQTLLFPQILAIINIENKKGDKYNGEKRNYDKKGIFGDRDGTRSP